MLRRVGGRGALENPVHRDTRARQIAPLRPRQLLSRPSGGAENNLVEYYPPPEPQVHVGVAYPPSWTAVVLSWVYHTALINMY